MEEGGNGDGCSNKCDEYCRSFRFNLGQLVSTLVKLGQVQNTGHRSQVIVLPITETTITVYKINANIIIFFLKFHFKNVLSEQRTASDLLHTEVHDCENVRYTPDKPITSLIHI